MSSDAELNRIWEIGWRTMRVDAHETFMDSSYWEQLQYTGDTRLEMLITYAVSGDARLARQAIDAFAESDVDGGLVQGAYPSRLPNVIATFSFAWVGMLSDWALEQPDTALIVKHLPRMRRVLNWFEPLLNQQGLLGKNPQWNFIDWSGQKWDDRDTFPSWGSQNGSCLMTAMWVGALRQGAALELAHGDAARAADFGAKADRARTAIREHCWVADKGLFADDGDQQGLQPAHERVRGALRHRDSEEAAANSRARSPSAIAASTRRPACTRPPAISRGTWCALSSTWESPSATSICSRPGETCWR